MKKYTLFLFLLSILTTTFAQNTIGIEENDPKARAILDEVKNKYESYASLDLDFSLTIEFPEDDPEVQKGHLSQKGEQFKLDLGNQSITSDGKTMWFYLKSRNEVQVNNVDASMDDDELLSPQKLLKIYESDDYLYALVGEAIEDGKTVQKIEFKPLDSDSEYFKMRLTVDKKSKAILGIKTFAKDGSRYTLTIDKLEPNKNFGDAFFKFDPKKYPGIYVEDLRVD